MGARQTPVVRLLCLPRRLLRRRHCRHQSKATGNIINTILFHLPRAPLFCFLHLASPPPPPLAFSRSASRGFIHYYATSSLNFCFWFEGPNQKAEIFEVRHDVKARLTLSASGAAGGGEGARTHIQVLANSAVASVLVFLHARRLQLQAQQLQQQQQQSPSPFSSPNCWDWRKDVLVPGIIA